jgi:hypothetical protein
MKSSHNQKVERWAEKELLRNIKHVIIDDDTGSVDTILNPLIRAAVSALGIATYTHSPTVAMLSVGAWLTNIINTIWPTTYRCWTAKDSS